MVLGARDIALVTVAFCLAWLARYRLGLWLALDPGNYVGHEVYLPLQLSLSVVFASILGLRGLYRLPRAAGALDDVSTIFTASGLSVMLLFAGSTFVRYPAESRLTLIFAWVLMTFLVVLGRANWLWILGALHQHGIGVARTLVVGDHTVGGVRMHTPDDLPYLQHDGSVLLVND